MPIFCFICECGAKLERLIEQNKTPEAVCIRCDKPMKRDYSREIPSAGTMAPHTIWTDDITGSPQRFDSHHALDNELKKHGLTMKKAGRSDVNARYPVD